jgi:hypothetical protein
LSLAAGEAAGSAAAAVSGWEPLTRLHQLAQFRTVREVGCVSSYDRSGGNDDGFSGRYSYVREEAGGLVIADLQGPGIIHRIWTPTPSDDDVEFYFDGEEVPRIRVPFRQIFLGHVPPFNAPWVGYGVGGFYSYVPLPFSRTCKVVVRGKHVQFYQINYTLYQANTPVQTYTPELPEELRRQRDRAQRFWVAPGTDLSAEISPADARARTVAQRVNLPPGRSQVVFESKRAGRLAGLRFSPAQALAGKGRDILLRISFDGAAPAVLCPAGDFFGFAFGQPAMQSLLVGTTGDVCYAYFPMPFDASVLVELVSERVDGPSLRIDAEVVWSDAARGSGEGRFHAVWRRENPTRLGAPFTFLDVPGRGQVVGFVLQAQGFESGKTLFFEGDDQTWIDGKLAVHGTGSEDFFNGGWYDVPDRWEKRLSLPLSGCLGYQKHLGRTGGYRLMLGDAYVYERHIRQTIEHAGTENSIPTDYCGLTYFYTDANALPAPELPPVSARGVVDLTDIVFPAWWQIPIRAFPFHQASLTRKLVKLGGEEVRFLSMRAEGQDLFGPPFLQVVCDVPAAGRYDILLAGVRGPDQASIQLFRDEIAVGDPVDLYAEAPAKSGRLKLGALDLHAGENAVMLKLVGKHAQASGLGLDLVEVVCVNQAR